MNEWKTVVFPFRDGKIPIEAALWVCAHTDCVVFERVADGLSVTYSGDDIPPPDVIPTPLLEAQPFPTMPRRKAISPITFPGLER